MPPSGGDLQGPLHLLLALHLCQVGTVDGGCPRRPGRGRGDGLCPGEVADQLGHVPDGIDGGPLRQGGFGGVLLRDIQGGDPLPLGGQGHGQHPGAGPQLSGEGQLPQKGTVPVWEHDLSAGGQDADQHGQVIEGPHLFQVGRGQIDGDPADREGEAAVLDGGAHPLPGLVDGGVWQTYHSESGQPAGQVAFGGHRIAGDSLEPQRTDRSYHILTS